MERKKEYRKRFNFEDLSVIVHRLWRVYYTNIPRQYCDCMVWKCLDAKI
jgi:hypothetical protein